MTTICIIACYFGKLPEYYNLWYKSCKNNKEINFLLITDQMESLKDENVQIVNMNIEQLEKLAKKKLKIENIWLKKPYKICDFRPAFGIVFEDYLKGFNFWGHCDIDQIFGNVRNFITEEILNKYDKILQNGNLSLYRNSSKMNNLYKEEGAIYSYKKVFTTKENYAFDEFTGINRIVKKKNINCFYENFFADIDPKYNRFKVVDGKNYKHQIFYYDNGEICRAYIEDDENIKINKYSHIHFQKRKLEILNENVGNKFYINEQGFSKMLDSINQKDIIENSKYTDEFEEKREKFNYLIKKIMIFLKCSLKQKRIWLKQRIFIRR